MVCYFHNQLIFDNSGPLPWSAFTKYNIYQLRALRIQSYTTYSLLLQESFRLSLFPVLDGKRSWAGHDPTQSKMTAENAIANTDNMAWAQLLRATNTRLVHPNSHAMLAYI